VTARTGPGDGPSDPDVVLTSLPLADDLRAAFAGHRIMDAAAAGTQDRERTVGLLVNREVAVDEALLEGLPALRVVSQFGVGYDNVDVAAASRRGIAVCHTPEVLDDAVAELSIALVIMLRREILPAVEFVRRGEWSTGRAPLARDAAGSVLGIVGYGRIGRRVAELARALRMRVVHGRPDRDADPADPESRSWDDLFAEADVVSVHAPLTAETRGLISTRELALIRPGGHLVNTARGGIVDEDALLAAITSGHLGGAALDVLADEPVGSAHPFAAFPQVIVLPHIGSSTLETRHAMFELAVANLAGVLGGGPAVLVPESRAIARTGAVQ
jgi:lactate dehydrogenase-like 2-hydroxyacid dehydrogenase